MCEYCEGKNKIKNSEFKVVKGKSGNYAELYIKTDKDGQRLYIDNGWGVLKTSVNYCFNCGEKLRKEKINEKI